MSQKIDSVDKDANGKYSVSEQSCGGDSGFISSGHNLTSSGDICDSGILEDSSREELEFHQQKSSTELESMRLDSGVVDVGLGECFSHLSLKGPRADLNDFDKFEKGKDSTPSIDVSLSKDEKAPWELYYQQDEEGNTQLHIAIIAGMWDAVRAVVSMAPHPMLLGIKNDMSQAPTHLAVLTGQANVLRLLLVAGAEATTQDARGNTPLHLACETGDLECVRALTSPIAEREYMSLLATRGDMSSATCQQLPPDLEQWNYDGEVCVHLAARGQHIEILRHLVWYGADINAREGKSGCTVLHFAVKHNLRTLVGFLLNDCPKLSVETETYSGRTAYQLATDKELMSMLANSGAIPLDNSDDEYSDSDDNEISSSTTNYYNQNFNQTTNAINVA